MQVPDKYNEEAIPLKKGYRKNHKDDANWLFFNNDAKGGVKVVKTVEELYEIPVGLLDIRRTIGVVVSNDNATTYALVSFPANATKKTKTTSANWINTTILSQVVAGGIKYINTFDPNGYDGTTATVKDSETRNAGDFYIVTNAPEATAPVTITDSAIFGGETTTLTNKDWVIYDGERYRHIYQAEANEVTWAQIEPTAPNFSEVGHSHDSDAIGITDPEGAETTLTLLANRILYDVDLISTVTDAVAQVNKAITLGLADGRYILATKILTDLSVNPNDNSKIVGANLIYAIKETADGAITPQELEDNLTAKGYTTYSSTDFNTDFNSKTTDGLSEGTVNLYLTQVNLATVFTGMTSDDLPVEGTTKLYLTSAERNKIVNIPPDPANPTSDEYITRAWAENNILGSSIQALYLNSSVTSTAGLKALATDELSENNYTLYRDSADTFLKAYKLVFGTATESLPDTVIPNDYDATTNAKYWQLAVSGGTDLSTATTDDLAEGATNKYYTEARVSANTDVAANTAKNSYPSTDANKLANIEEGAEVNPTIEQELSQSTTAVPSSKLLDDELKILHTELTTFNAVLDFSKNTTIRHTVTGAINFTLGTNPVPKLGKKAIFYLVADGLNAPTFGTGFIEKFNNYDNTQNKVNRCYFEYVGNNTVLYEITYV